MGLGALDCCWGFFFAAGLPRGRLAGGLPRSLRAGISGFEPSSLHATAPKSCRIVESPMKTMRSWRSAHRDIVRPTRA